MRVPARGPHLYHFVHRAGDEHEITRVARLVVVYLEIGKQRRGLDVDGQHFVPVPERAREDEHADAVVDVPQTTRLILGRGEKQVRRAGVRADVVDAPAVSPQVAKQRQALFSRNSVIRRSGAHVQHPHHPRLPREREQELARGGLAPRAGEVLLVLVVVLERAEQRDAAIVLEAVHGRAVRAHGGEQTRVVRAQRAHGDAVQVLAVLFLEHGDALVLARRAALQEHGRVRGRVRVHRPLAPLRHLAVPRHGARASLPRTPAMTRRAHLAVPIGSFTSVSTRS